MKALCIGEILWDIDGETRTLGGAPLNVAGHISRLGGEAWILSALGHDELGKLSRDAIRTLGVHDAFINDSEFDTGYAKVTLTDGIPSYSFNDPSAWDDIEIAESQLEELGKIRFDAVVFGTLASRHDCSRNTIFKILDRVDAKEFFFDVNLRLSFYTDELIRAGLERATILKMNDEEIPIVAKAIGSRDADVIDLLLKMPRMKRVLVTMGKHGSACYERDGVSHAEAKKVKAVDTVGAGDSLSAAFLYFISQGLSTSDALSRASALADYIVTKRGAIPDYDDEIRKALSI